MLTSSSCIVAKQILQLLLALEGTPCISVLLPASDLPGSDQQNHSNKANHSAFHKLLGTSIHSRPHGTTSYAFPPSGGSIPGLAKIPKKEIFTAAPALAPAAVPPLEALPKVNVSNEEVAQEISDNPPLEEAVEASSKTEGEQKRSDKENSDKVKKDAIDETISLVGLFALMVLIISLFLLYRQSEERRIYAESTMDVLKPQGEADPKEAYPGGGADPAPDPLPENGEAPVSADAGTPSAPAPPS